MEPWEALALRAQAGDTAAAGELFGRLRPVLLKLARSVQAAGHDVEDLAQAALLRVWERLPRYTYPRPFGAWVKVVGRRVFLDLVRRTDPMAGEEEISDQVADRPPDRADVADLPSWWVPEVMRGLSDQEKADVSERFGFVGPQKTGRQVARSGRRRDAQVRKQLRASVAWMRLVFETRYGLVA